MNINTEMVKSHNGRIIYVNSSLTMKELHEYREFQITQPPTLSYSCNYRYGVYVTYTCVIDDQYSRYKHVEIPLFLFDGSPQVQDFCVDSECVRLNQTNIIFVTSSINQFKSKLEFKTNDLIMVNKYIFGQHWTDFLESIDIEWYIE